MTQKRDLILIKLAFAAVFVGVLALSVLLAPAAQAGLPARNTPTPVREQQQEDKSKDNGPSGAWIELQAELHAQPAPAEAWSVVQWQNELGDWYDVEGWRGSLDGNGYQRWWVHEKDFGDGPFRWVVRQGKGGPDLGVSQAFNLPGGANETVRVTVSPGP